MTKLKVFIRGQRWSGLEFTPPPPKPVPAWKRVLASLGLAKRP
jgi:hypothetical protein